MERLTEIETKGPRRGKWTYNMEVSVNDLCEKLAAYEDTNLTPEQIIAMQSLLKYQDDRVGRLTACNAELEEAARWVPVRCSSCGGCGHIPVASYQSVLTQCSACGGSGIIWRKPDAPKGEQL